MSNTIKNRSPEISPFIPANKEIAEITFKGTILAILLAMLLAAANTYLGLKIGITITGAIPAAIISMALLRLFKSSTILENNIVQTGASAGDTLAAGAIFTLPAILIVKYWLGFEFWPCFIITLTGGILGVLFSIPLRRAFIHDPHLKFPEGVAIGNVLKASQETGLNAQKMILGTIISAIIAIAQNGLKILADSAWCLFKVGGTIVGIGTGFDMAIIGAGYIVGINIGLSILVGAILAWLIALPIFGYLHGFDANLSNVDIAIQIWSEHIRYVAIGTMSIGGIWALFSLLRPVIMGVKSSIQAFSDKKNTGHKSILRTERDIPINYVFWGILIILIFSGLIFKTAIDATNLPLSSDIVYTILGLNIIFLITIGLVLSAICCYLAGLVGSSSNPMSGLLISGILIIALILLPIFSLQISFDDPENVKRAVGLTIVIIAIIGCATAIAQDNMQDLKAGQIVGATPWKQQIMLLVGVLSAALVIPPTLDLLFNAYGIGGIFPREGMDPDQILGAPQAALMASVATGVYGLNLPWTKIFVGMLIGIAVIMVDKFLQHRSGRKLPVLAVGIGLYLPIAASLPLVLGSILSFVVNSKLNKHTTKQSNNEIKEQSQQIGISIASGFVCGGSIMGIILAIPAVIYQSTDTLRIVSTQFQTTSEILMIITLLGTAYWFYNTVISYFNSHDNHSA